MGCHQLFTVVGISPSCTRHREMTSFFKGHAPSWFACPYSGFSTQPPPQAHTVFQTTSSIANSNRRSAFVVQRIEFALHRISEWAAYYQLPTHLSTASYLATYGLQTLGSICQGFYSGSCEPTLPPLLNVHCQCTQLLRECQVAYQAAYREALPARPRDCETGRKRGGRSACQ